MSRNTHNDIQQVCTGDEEFVVGEIYGLRQWTYVDTLRPGGDRWVLVGHRSHFWHAGENVATCSLKSYSENKRITVNLDPWEGANEEKILRAISKVFSNDLEITSVTVYISGLPARAFFPDQFEIGTPDWKSMYWFSQNWSRGYKTISLHLVCTKKLPPHNIADPTCTCGFYAYTDEQSLLDNSLSPGIDGKIFGIVRAYGHVTEGTKGFRAEKAQIVALTPPLTLQEDTPKFLWDSTTLDTFSREWIWVPERRSWPWRTYLKPSLPPQLQICNTFPELISTFKEYQMKGN